MNGQLTYQSIHSLTHSFQGNLVGLLYLISSLDAIELPIVIVLRDVAKLEQSLPFTSMHDLRNW
jgi:hypothetical protein